MNKKLFIETYRFVCSKCGVFSHAFHEECENCGAYKTFRSTESQDYR